MKHYAKKRSAVAAVQWTGEITAEVQELIGDRSAQIDTDRRLILGNGWFVPVGAWVVSASGEDLFPIGEDDFRQTYEETDATGRARPPTDAEHDAAAREFGRQLDVVLLAGLKLTREEHPSIFRDREQLLRALRHLLEDQSYTAARHERHRIRDKIAKELTP